MNVLTVFGNLGSDVRTNNVGGTAVANFSVAVKSGYGDNEKTIWVDCSLWGKRAESGLIDYLKKGQQVVVSGEMGTREYDGKTYITMRVNEVSLAGGRSNGQQAQPAQPVQQTQQGATHGNYASAPDIDDDIPF